MKTLQLLRLPLAFLCGGLVAGAQFTPQLVPASDYVPMKFIQTVAPVFPQKVLALGLKSGEATVAIQIDTDGALTDFLVTTYSHPAFAEVAVAALRKWRYEPARIHGAPRSAKADLTFNFEAQGVVVVDMSVLEQAEMLRFRISPNAMTYSASTLSQLDRIPTPIKIVKPVYPENIARSSHGGRITVEFYIDEQGHVRLPSVDRETIEANGELSAMAITAVEQWQFEPPLVNGRPVVTLAQQNFNFKPAAP
jgi:TonB family protein